MPDRRTLDGIKRDLEKARAAVGLNGDNSTSTLSPSDDVARVNETTVAIALSDESADELHAAVTDLDARNPGVDAADILGPTWVAEVRRDGPRGRTGRGDGCGDTLTLDLRMHGLNDSMKAVLDQLTGRPNAVADRLDEGDRSSFDPSPERVCSLSLTTSERVSRALRSIHTPIDARPWDLALDLGADPPRVTARPTSPHLSNAELTERSKRIDKKFD